MLMIQLQSELVGIGKTRNREIGSITEVGNGAHENEKHFFQLKRGG